MDTSLLSVISFIEEQLRWKVLLIGTLLDNDGAFNHTTTEAIKRRAKEHSFQRPLSSA